MNNFVKSSKKGGYDCQEVKDRKKSSKRRLILYFYRLKIVIKIIITVGIISSILSEKNFRFSDGQMYLRNI